MTPTARHFWLFLRSRRAALTTLWLATSAVATWAMLRASDDPTTIKLILIIAPLAPAVLLAVGQHSPFGELERACGTGLPALRLAHLAGLLALGGGALAAANGAAGGEDFHWLLVRNGAGYAGIALLGGWLSGASLAWIPTLAYVTFIFVAALGRILARENGWLWPIHPPAERPAIAIAGALLALGLAVAIPLGARTSADERA